MENKTCGWCGTEKNLRETPCSDGTMGHMCKDCIEEGTEEGKSLLEQLDEDLKASPWDLLGK